MTRRLFPLALAALALTAACNADSTLAPANRDAIVASTPCNPGDSLSVINGKRPCEGNRWTAASNKGR